MKRHVEVSGVIIRLFLLANKPRKEKKKPFLTISEIQSLEIASEINEMLENGVKQIVSSAGLHGGFKPGQVIYLLSEGSSFHDQLFLPLLQDETKQIHNYKHSREYRTL